MPLTLEQMATTKKKPLSLDEMAATKKEPLSLDEMAKVQTTPTAVKTLPKPEPLLSWGRAEPEVKGRLPGLREMTAPIEEPEQPLPRMQVPRPVRRTTPRDIRPPTTKQAHPGIIERAVKQFWNKGIVDVGHELAKSDEPALFKAYEIQRARMAKRKKAGVRKFPEVLLDDEFKDIVRELGERPEAREDDDLRKISQVFPIGEDVNPFPKFNIPPGQDPGDYIADTIAGLGTFIAQIYFLKKVLPGAPSQMIWEIRNVATGGKPGKGAAINTALKSISQIPTVSRIGKGVKIAAGGGLFGGLTYAEGGDWIDVAVSTAIGAGFQGWDIHKQNQWLKNFKSHLKKGEYVKSQQAIAKGYKQAQQVYQQDLAAGMKQADAKFKYQRNLRDATRVGERMLKDIEPKIDRAMDIVARRLHHGKLEGREAKLAKEIVEKGLTPEAVAEVAKVRLPKKPRVELAKKGFPVTEERLFKLKPAKGSPAARAREAVRVAKPGLEAIAEALPKPTEPPLTPFARPPVAKVPTKAIKVPAKPTPTIEPPHLKDLYYLTTYEKGRFLHEASTRISKPQYEDIIDWAKETKEPLAMQPQTKESFITALLKKYAPAKPAVEGKVEKIQFAPTEDIKLLEQLRNNQIDFNKKRVSKKRQAEIVEQSKQLRTDLRKQGYSPEYIKAVEMEDIGLPVQARPAPAKPAPAVKLQRKSVQAIERDFWEGKISYENTLKALEQKRIQIESDPKSKLPKGGFRIYTKAAERKLNEVGWAITRTLAKKPTAKPAKVPPKVEITPTKPAVEGKPFKAVVFRGISEKTPIATGLAEGTHYTTDKKLAQSFAEDYGKGKLIEKKITLKNPLYLTDESRFGAEADKIIAEEEAKGAVYSQKERDKRAATIMRETLEKQGYDGIVYNEGKEIIVLAKPAVEGKVGELTGIALRNRLRQAQNDLTSETKKAFGKMSFDEAGKRLVSEDGTMVLQWYSGYSPRGYVRIDKIKPAPTAKAAKEPWEIEEGEWIKIVQKERQFTPAPGSHEAYVEEAVEQGKPVPREVLEEYKSEKWAKDALWKLETPTPTKVERVSPDKFKELQYRAARAKNPNLEREIKPYAEGWQKDLTIKKYKELEAKVVKSEKWAQEALEKAAPAVKGVRLLNPELSDEEYFRNLATLNAEQIRKEFDDIGLKKLPSLEDTVVRRQFEIAMADGKAKDKADAENKLFNLGLTFEQQREHFEKAAELIDKSKAAKRREELKLAKPAEAKKKVVPEQQARKLRHDIHAVAAVKGLTKKALTELKVKHTGYRTLTGKVAQKKITLEQLQSLLKAVQKTRPKRIGYKRVITKKTEDKIQSLKDNLIKKTQMTEIDYRIVLQKEIYGKQPKYVDSKRFITETQGKDIIKRMLDGAEIVRVTEGYEKAIRENKDITEQVRKLDRRIKKKPKRDPYSLESMRYYNQQAEVKTGAPFYAVYMDLLDTHLDNTKTRTATWKKLENIVGKKQFRIISRDEEALKRVRNYIAAQSMLKVKPAMPTGITDAEVKMAKEIQAILKDYQLKARTAKFFNFYYYNQPIAEYDRYKREINTAVDIYESKGKDDLIEYLKTQEWGVIRSGYEPLEVLRQRIRPYTTGPTGVGKGHIKIRTDVEYHTQERNILQRLSSYMRQVDMLYNLSPKINAYVRLYDDNMKKFNKPGVVRENIEIFLRNLKRYNIQGGFFERTLARLYSQAMRTIIMPSPVLSFRNLFQNLALEHDKTILIDPRNKTLTDKDIEYLETYVLQTRAMIEEYFMVAEKPIWGLRFLTKLVDKVRLYPHSDIANRRWSFWAKINQVRRALDSKTTAEMMKKARFEDMAELEQRRALGILAKDGKEAMARYATRVHVDDIHFLYERSQRSPAEMTPLGRVVGNLFLFPRAYGEKLAHATNKTLRGKTYREHWRGLKMLFAVIAGGMIVGAIYQKITGRRRNPYNPLDILSFRPGGLAWGTVEATTDIYVNILSATKGDSRALAMLTTAIPKAADMFIPFYDYTLRGIEAATDQKNVDRKILRQLRMMIDKEYKIRGGAYKVQRNALEKWQYFIAGAGVDQKIKEREKGKISRKILERKPIERKVLKRKILER